MKSINSKGLLGGYIKNGQKELRTEIVKSMNKKSEHSDENPKSGLQSISDERK